jgi:hypothetical protein
MSLERRITHAAAKAAVAWSNGDEDQAQYWEAQAILLMDERDAQRPHSRAGRVRVRPGQLLRSARVMSGELCCWRYEDCDCCGGRGGDCHDCHCMRPDCADCNWMPAEDES